MTINAKPPVESEINLAAEYARYSQLGILKRRVRLGWLGSLWQFLLVVNGWGKRAFDLIFACSLLIALFPLLILIAIWQLGSQRRALILDARIGRWGVPFQLLELNFDDNPTALARRLYIHRLPQLLNVIRGDMSLIGPRAARPGDLDLHQRALQKRSSVRPGIVSLWWLRKRANIDFTSELAVDLEYIDKQSVRGDVGIALRALPALLYGSGTATAPEHVDVLGVPMRNITMEEALEYILTAPSEPTPKQLCFVNTDCVNKAQSNAEYAACLRTADAVLADGIGIRIAGKILRQEIRQNVNGTDLFPLLCGRLETLDQGIYLLGAKPGIVEDVRDWVARNYPLAKISGVHHGYFTAEEEPEVLRQIKASGAQILLVAFGAPRQELWISQHLAGSGVSIAMGVGGLFDFYSGRIPRAPQWMRELSLEWIFRLMQEPSRMWKRYLVGNVVFLARVMWWVLSRRKTSSTAMEMGD